MSGSGPSKKSSFLIHPSSHPHPINHNSINQIIFSCPVSSISLPSSPFLLSIWQHTRMDHQVLQCQRRAKTDWMLFASVTQTSQRNILHYAKALWHSVESPFAGRCVFEWHGNQRSMSAVSLLPSGKSVVISNIKSNKQKKQLRHNFKRTYVLILSWDVVETVQNY